MLYFDNRRRPKTRAGSRGRNPRGTSPEGHGRSVDRLLSPRIESLVAAAVQWAERIMRKIDNVFPKLMLSYVRTRVYC
jgi:hypothetical protein